MTQITDDEFTGEAILIAGLEAELEKRDRVINALDQQLCEARTELSSNQYELIKAKRFLQMIYSEANDDGGVVYLSGKQMSQISEMINND